MTPKLAAKRATGPAQADNRTLEAYQRQLMLLELQRQKLEALRVSTGAPTAHNAPEQVQGEGDIQLSVSALQTFLRQSNRVSVPVSNEVEIGKGDKIKRANSGVRRVGDKDGEDAVSGNGESEDKDSKDEDSNEERDSEDETEEEEGEEESNGEEEKDDAVYCACRRAGYGNMLRCNNKNCRC